MLMRLLRKTKTRAVYKLKDFQALDNKFFENYKWQDNLRGIILSFSNKIKNEEEVMGAISGKFKVTLGYSVESTKLVNSGCKLPTSIKPVKLESAELHKLFCGTQARFYSKWRKRLGPVYLKESREIAASMLGSAKVACLKKNGKAAGLLVVVQWKDFLDVPVNWVVWVWINNALSAEERKGIRCYFSGWMKKHLRGRIQCVVNAFNLKSHGFFKNLGFYPECVHYIRTK